MNIHLPNTRPGWNTTDMEILENPLEWLREFQDGWLSNYERSGVADWSLYIPPKNLAVPHSRGISLADSRLILITTAGAYFPGHHTPFRGQDSLGDYSIREIPVATSLESLTFSHPELDADVIQQDPQTVAPVRLLQEMVAKKQLGSLAPAFLSYSGFQPHAIRIVKELVPQILKAAREYGAHAALIVPAGRLSIQSAGLVARALEVNHIAATLTGWDHTSIEQTAPPRGTATALSPSCPLGAPGDEAQQRRVLEATLGMLEKHAPAGIHVLDEAA